ncbi:TPA: DUF927 domain-containing protein [Clostridioides difficile]|nr:DUF927 domain-containing protein [Clostridioides difficile]
MEAKIERKQGQGIFKTEDGEENKVANDTWIELCHINIDTNERYITISYIDSFGRVNTEQLERQELLNTKNIIKLQGKGMDVNQFNAGDLVKYFIKEERQSKLVSVHTNIGFDEQEGKVIYKAFNSVGTESTYTGSYDIKPKGKKEIWLDMFEEEVLGNANLELICSISLTSLLIGFIGEEYLLETLIVHLVGNSTTGKSTALRLGISFFGCVDVGNNSLFSTYNTTHNAMMKRAAGTKGVTFAFDELSISNTANFTQTVYTLSQGVDKARLNKNSEQKEQGTWLGVILSNGEKSLLNSSNKNAGIQMRVIEIENVSWTSSADNAEKINKIIVKNNGHIAIEIAQYMIELGKEEVSKRYEENVGILKKVMNANNLVDEFTSRRVSKLATIITTAKIFEEYLSKELGKEVKLDIKGMIKILLNVEKESIKSRNFDKSVLEHIRQYVVDNKNKFEISGKEKPKGEVLGKLTKKKEYTELEITPSRFEKMIKEGGFEDKNVVLKELKNKGILDCDSDRYTRKRMTDVGKLPVIVIKFPRKDK